MDLGGDPLGDELTFTGQDNNSSILRPKVKDQVLDPIDTDPVRDMVPVLQLRPELAVGHDLF